MSDKKKRMKPGRRFPKPLSGRSLEGILKVPIANLDFREFELGKRSGHLVQSYEDENFRHTTRQQVERINALAVHYGLYELGPHDDGAYVKDLLSQLFLKLAEDFVVGFNNRENIGNAQRGRNEGEGQLRDDVELGQFYLEVQHLKSSGKKELDAIRSICRQNPKLKGVDPKALMKQLERFQERLSFFKKDADRNLAYLAIRAAGERNTQK